MEIENNSSTENVNNEDNSNNSNADNVDNTNGNNTIRFRIISDFLVNTFGIIPIVGALVYIYQYIVAYSKSSYYNIPIKYFYSNSEMVKPIIFIIFIVCIFLPHLKNLKYKIIEKNIVILSKLSLIFSFISLFILLIYTIDQPTNILTKIVLIIGFIIVGSYVKLNKERTDIFVCIVIAIISTGFCIAEKIDLNFLPILLMFILVIYNYDNKTRNIFMSFVKIIVIVMLTVLFLYLLLYLNTIMTEIAYRSDYELIETSVEENNTTHYKIIITEYNDSFIIMDGTVTNSGLTIYNSKFNFIDKNDLDGCIRYLIFKNIDMVSEYN